VCSVGLAALASVAECNRKLRNRNEALGIHPMGWRGGWNR
jgi:hypothetical protein